MRRRRAPTWSAAALVSGVVAALLVGSCTPAARPAPDPRDAVADLFPAPLAAPSAEALPVAAQDALTDVLRDVVAASRQRTPTARGAIGLVVAVVSDRGSWSGAAGTDAAGQELRPDSVAPVGGATTTFLAAEALHLASVGRLDLDALAADHLDHPLLRDGVTTRQLLGMRAGVRDNELDDALVPTASAPGTADDVLRLVAAPSVRPTADPVYSAASSALVQLVLEDVTGAPLAETVAADFLTPYGLGPSGPAGGCALPAGVHHLTGEGGGMLCDARTLARWAYLLYGGRVLGVPAATEMTTAPDAQLGRQLRATYGLGTMRFETGFGLEAVGYLGDGAGGSTGLAVVREQSMAVAVLAVGDGRDTAALVERVVVAAHALR